MRAPLVASLMMFLVSTGGVSLHADDFLGVATVSDTLGVNAGRLCVGEDDNRESLGCPTYAPDLDSSGNVSTTGYVSATEFYGDGSNLIGISTVSALNDLSDAATAGQTAGMVLAYDGSNWVPSSTLTNFVGISASGVISASRVSTTGNIYAAEFYGDGSNLLNVTASSVDWSNVASKPTSLTDIIALTPDDGEIAIGDGTTWVAESGATARTSLGLGTSDAVTFDTLTGTNGLTGALQTAAQPNITSVGTLTDLNVAGEVTATNVSTEQLCDESGANCHDLSAGITASSVDWYDVSNIPAGVSAISVTALTSGELGELQNIDSETITNTQWGYLGELDQSVLTTADVTFASVAATEVTATNVSVEQLCDENGANCTDVSGGFSTVSALNDLSDAATAGQTAGMVLAYDGSNWVPSSTLTNFVGISASGVISASRVSTTGNIYAAEFYGDGSNLLNVTASSVDWSNVASKPTSMTDLIAITPDNGEIIVGDGTTWVAESGATARTSLGLGTSDNVTFNTLTGTNGLTGTLATFAQPNIQSVGILDNISTTGHTSATTISATRVTAAYVSGTHYGDGSNLTGVSADDADTLDSLDSLQFLRSDADDTYTGTLTLTGQMNATSLTVDTDTLYVDSSNDRMGVGTAIPQTELEVIGQISATHILAAEEITATTSISTAQLCDENGANCTDVSGGFSSVSAFDDLTDVNVSGPGAGNVVAYDGSNWVSTTELTGLSAVSVTGHVSMSSLYVANDMSISGIISVTQLYVGGDLINGSTLDPTVSTTTMVSGWPDAIYCSGTGGFATFMLSSNDGSTGVATYSLAADYGSISDSNRPLMRYNGTTKAQTEHNTNGGWGNWMTNCNGKSIATLYSDGQAFNFLGNNGAQISLTEIADVSASAPSDGEALVWNDSQNRWIPGSAGATAAGSQGEIQFQGASTDLSASSSFYWDNTNARLGIGDSAPQYDVHVSRTVDSAVQLRVSNMSDGTDAYSGVAVENDTGGVGWLWAASSQYTASSLGHFANRMNLYATSPLDGVDVVAQAATGTIAFYTGGYATSNERMVIDADGMVGISTTTPNATLDVSGTVKMAGTGSETCDSNAVGTMRYNPSTQVFEVCRD